MFTRFAENTGILSQAMDTESEAAAVPPSVNDDAVEGVASAALLTSSSAFAVDSTVLAVFSIALPSFLKN